MKTDSDKKGLLTVGNTDSRITHSGLWLRKYKLDELPQLFNVLLGDMSLVGPRPEVRKYVDMYSPEQLQVLSVKPGITDNASIEYADENELLSKHSDPENFYISEVMPAKLRINLEYISNQSVAEDLRIILKTFLRIFKK
jgi:lipopolysaccharide/colanic/teichoic acid biosynthesis glycosyltransferase